MLSLILMTFVSGCASFAGTSGCSVFGIITVSKDDVLTDQTARELLAHNETYISVCGE